MALVAALTLVLGFSFDPSPNTSSYIKRWTMPPSADSEEGLGGGIAFAVEPDFCSKVMGSLVDSSYATCEYIEQATLRAFDTWAANHPDISFVNVSEACAADPAVVACMSSASSQYYLRGNCTRLCSAAEVFVLAEYTRAGASTLSSLPMQVEHLPALTGLSVTQLITQNLVPTRTGPRATSGQVIAQDRVIEAATLTVNQGQCMYLDDTFCYGMHEMEEKGIRVVILFSFLMMPPFACILVALTLRCCKGCHNFYRQKQGTCSASFCGSMYIVSTPIWLTWFLLTLGILCPYVYFSIAEPCVRCFSFEASMVQATGQVLGLSDPAAPGHMNFKPAASYDFASCDDPSSAGYARSVVEATPFVNTPLGQGPAMLTPTKSRPEPCPSLDDLQGLNLLYPTCGQSRESEPQCINSHASYGVLRFAEVVVLGIFVSFIVVVICSCSSKWLSEKWADEQDDAPRKAPTGGNAPYPSLTEQTTQSSDDVLERRPPGADDEEEELSVTRQQLPQEAVVSEEDIELAETSTVVTDAPAPAPDSRMHRI